MLPAVLPAVQMSSRGINVTMAIDQIQRPGDDKAAPASLDREDHARLADMILRRLTETRLLDPLDEVKQRLARVEQDVDKHSRYFLLQKWGLLGLVLLATMACFVVAVTQCAYYGQDPGADEASVSVPPDYPKGGLAQTRRCFNPLQPLQPDPHTGLYVGCSAPLVYVKRGLAGDRPYCWLPAPPPPQCARGLAHRQLMSRNQPILYVCAFCCPAIRESMAAIHTTTRAGCTRTRRKPCAPARSATPTTRAGPCPRGYLEHFADSALRACVSVCGRVCVNVRAHVSTLWSRLPSQRSRDT